MQTSTKDRLDHFRIPGIPGENYLLLCDGAPVTVRSQQIRALNLLSALHASILGLHSSAADLYEKKSLTGKTVAVIGGGAGGLMFASGAASLGARVELFEKNPALLHLQRGCWHRPLHPEIFKWPDDTAYRAYSHLPLLGWSAGRAHDVADEILTKFNAVVQRVGKENLKVTPNQTAQLQDDGQVKFGSMLRRFNIVVLAVGFGIEDMPYDLPWNSYWRADPLDQSFLEERPNRPRILVVGSGDGALIEVLRSCVQSFELGALLDSILNATLDDRELRERVKSIEDNNRPGAAGSRLKDYCEIVSPRVADILGKHLRHSRVTWLMKEGSAFERFALPINRFIVSQLIQLSGAPGRKSKFLEGPIYNAEVSRVTRKEGKYEIKYRQEGHEITLECDHAIIRYGAGRETESEQSTDYRLHNSVTSAIVGPRKTEILNAIRERNANKMKKGEHKYCNEPQWERENVYGKSFADHKELSRVKLKENPVLHGRIVKAFQPQASFGKTVYRIHIWTSGVPEYLRLTYDLHSETGRSVSRIGGGPNHDQWINTYADYTIRARSNEGSEFPLGTVIQALMHEQAAAEKVGNAQVQFPKESESDPEKKEVDTFENAILNLLKHRAQPRHPPTPAAEAVP